VWIGDRWEEKTEEEEEEDKLGTGVTIHTRLSVGLGECWALSRCVSMYARALLLCCVFFFFF
jgi:hypothetical protein